MIELRKTAGIIQKYRAELAMPWASTLIKVVSFKAPAEPVLAKAIPIAPMKILRAVMIGRDLVARSAAKAFAVS